MAQISNLNDAQRAATLLRDRPDLDPETRTDLMLSLRAWDAAQNKTAAPVAEPQPSIRPPMDKATGINDRMPAIKAGSREVLAQAMTMGKGLAGVGLDAMEFSTLVGSDLLDALDLPTAAAAADQARTAVRDTRTAFDAQAARGLEMATGYTGFPGLGNFLWRLVGRCGRVRSG